MRAFFSGLSLAILLSAPVTARADAYDANAMMDTLTTRVVTSKGVKEVAPVPAWIKSELARQTAANRKDKKPAKISKIAKDKKVDRAKSKASGAPLRIVQLSTLEGAQEQAIAGTGYTPRVYHSQFFMPYSGHVSRPEAETDYREDYADYRF